MGCRVGKFGIISGQHVYIHYNNCTEKRTEYKSEVPPQQMQRCDGTVCVNTGVSTLAPLTAPFSSFHMWNLNEDESNTVWRFPSDSVHGGRFLVNFANKEGGARLMWCRLGLHSDRLLVVLIDKREPSGIALVNGFWNGETTVINGWTHGPIRLEDVSGRLVRLESNHGVTMDGLAE
jgi:hypothetical protein